jgi:1,4-dihydroxy-2-naphthoyl-CoA hydrolase
VPVRVSCRVISASSSRIGTTLDGTIVAVATPLHRGKTTQVWDAIVTHKESGRTLAVFRCTQMILYAKQNANRGFTRDEHAPKP